jgi:basic membrane protein A
VDAVRSGTWESQAYWYGLENGIVDLSPMSAMVPADVQANVMTQKEAIKKGAKKVFSGPVKDQAGKVKIADGKSGSDEELLGMNWFVQGVIGTTQ